MNNERHILEFFIYRSSDTYVKSVSIAKFYIDNNAITHIDEMIEIGIIKLLETPEYVYTNVYELTPKGEEYVKLQLL